VAVPNSPLYRISIGGAIANDTWSINLWGDGAGTSSTPSVGNMSDFAIEVFTDFDTAVWSAGTAPLKQANATSVNLSFCNVEYYFGGVIAQSSPNTFTPIVGTGTSNHPGYTCLVATLLTGLAGRSRRGRVYLPATALGVSATTLQQNGSPISYAQHMALWLSTFNSLPGNLPGDPAVPAVVVSRTTSAFNPVTSVRMDSIFDVQRGRQNKFIAATTVSANV